MSSILSLVNHTSKYNPKGKTKPNTIIDLINNRSKLQLDTRIIMTGEAGIGKSTLYLSLAELLDKDYVNNIKRTVKHKITFNGLDYMKAQNSEEPYSVIGMDEAGQSIHHREFMNEINIILSKTLIGNRFKRYIQVFCIPNLEMLDKDARSLCQFLFYVDKRGHAEIFRIKAPKLEGKTWYVKIRDHYNFNKPNIKLWHLYEKKKFNAQKELYESFQKIMEEKEKPLITNGDIIQTVLDKPDNYLSHKGKLHIPTIMGDFEIGRNRADGIAAKLRKDYKIEYKV